MIRAFCCNNQSDDSIVSGGKFKLRTGNYGPLASVSQGRRVGWAHQEINGLLVSLEVNVILQTSLIV